jgi:hypoxanthine phosphoribosyltransferase
MSSAADPKRFIDANEMQRLSEDLAMQVAGNGFRPTFLIGLWRGGAQPGVVVQEFLQRAQGTKIDHVAVRTSSRDSKTGDALADTAIHGTDYILSKITEEDRVLVVDDVWDSGRTGVAFKVFCRTKLGPRFPAEFKIATIFYKPEKNKYLPEKPDFFVEATDEWLVFPHELEGLSDAEIRKHRPHAAFLLYHLDVLKTEEEEIHSALEKIKAAGGELIPAVPFDEYYW